jgi:hypothetical protein
MNLAKDALHVLTSLAPTVATAIGGPFAGMAVNALESALGDKVTGSTPQDRQKSIESAILGGDPATLLKIRESENVLTEKMAEIGVQKDQLVISDKASARQREELVKDRTPAVLVTITTVGFFGALGALFFVTVPKESAGLVYSMLGALGTVWITQMSYYFGTSTTEERKSAALVEIAKS